MDEDETLKPPDSSNTRVENVAFNFPGGRWPTLNGTETSVLPALSKESFGTFEGERVVSCNVIKVIIEYFEKRVGRLESMTPISASSSLAGAHVTKRRLTEPPRVAPCRSIHPQAALDLPRSGSA